MRKCKYNVEQVDNDDGSKKNIVVKMIRIGIMMMMTKSQA